MLNNFFDFIGKGIVAASLAIGSFFGYHPADQNLGVTNMTPEVRALFTTSLSSSISSSATTFTLVSATDIDGNTLPTGTYGFIIDEGTSAEEMVLADCTSTACSAAVRGLSGKTGTTTVASLQKAHRRGASVKITDGPALIFAINVLKGKQNIENPLKYNSAVLTSATGTRALVDAIFTEGFAQTASTSVYNTLIGGNNTWSGTNLFNATTTAGTNKGFVQALVPTNAADLTNKAYVDSVAIAGASDASQTTKGIVEEATVTEINAGTATGGTGARLFVNPNLFQYSDFASSSPVVVATTSLQTMATTTITLGANLSAKTYLEVLFQSATTSGTGANGAGQTGIQFNGDTTAKYNVTGGTGENQALIEGSGATGPIMVILRIFNPQSTEIKSGVATIFRYATSTGAFSSLTSEAGFTYIGTSPISSVSFTQRGTNGVEGRIATSTYIRVTGY